MKSELLKTIRDIAITEIEQKSLEITRQYLDVLSVVYENDRPKIERIKVEKENSSATIYFPIKGEKFFLAVYLDISPTPAIRGVGDEAGNSISLVATSNTLSYKQMVELTTLRPLTGWSIGDHFERNPKMKHKESLIQYRPHKDLAEALEDKLEKILTELEKDKVGIGKLKQKTEVHIQAISTTYYGNGHIGGVNLSPQMIQRLNALGLQIDFSIWTGGRPLK